VAPEDLPQFYDVLVSGRGEFISGSRLVYAKDPHAMRFLNLLGNEFFALLLSRLLGQPIKDALCGTKVLYRGDYERMAKDRPIWVTLIRLATSICCLAQPSST
jgi:hypothetical protein